MVIPPTVQPLEADPADAGDDFGFTEALASAQHTLEETRRVLSHYRRSRTPGTDAPFQFDSKSMCVQAYRSAIERVTQRYWTTTFLSSGFWSSLDVAILGSNIRMLAARKRTGAAVRRLFLLPIPADEEIQRLVDERMVLRKCNDRVGLERFDHRLANLAQNIRTLIQHGCDVRIVHDATGHHRALPAALAFDPSDTEIAVYDDWRFDLFHGGRSGTIEAIRAFTPAMTTFAEHRDSVVDYFEQLWIDARPIEAFFERLQQAINSASARIDYHVSWLAQYDHGLPREDEDLKVTELNSVRVELARLERWGEITRYLDVGTCTGRYPLALRNAVRPDGCIVGVDSDPDCVRFTQANIDRICPGDQRFRIERHDICAPTLPAGGNFDLITCMMGTLSHFDHDGAAAPPHVDPLQRALEAFVRALAPGGLLFFTVWSEQACRELQLLSIYREADMRRLARTALAPDAFRQRLESLGLRVARPLLLDRLDLYRCERAR